MHTNKFLVYGIGNALVDYEYLVDDAFLAKHGLVKASMTLIDEKVKNNLFEELKSWKKKKGGGSAANTLIALAQLGAQTCYSCKVAKDTDGLFYLQDLVEQGVQHHLSQAALADHATGTCIVLVTPDSERTMCTFLGITAQYGVEQLNWNYLRKAEYLYIEGYLFCTEEGTRAVHEARKFATQHGIKIALTCSDAGIVQAIQSRFKDFFADPIDLIFCNQAEALALTETQEVFAALERLKKLASHVVITRSAEGVLTWDGAGVIETPARSVKAVDFNGAGDMFAGAYLYALSQNSADQKNKIAQAAQFACHCASEVIQVYGPRLEKERMQQLKSIYY